VTKRYESRGLSGVCKQRACVPARDRPPGLSAGPGAGGAARGRRGRGARRFPCIARAEAAAAAIIHRLSSIGTVNHTTLKRQHTRVKEQSVKFPREYKMQNYTKIDKIDHFLMCIKPNKKNPKVPQTQYRTTW